MARTIIGVNSDQAVKRWSGLLAYATSQRSYFNRRFMGRGPDAEVPVQIISDLESDAGDRVTYDLLAQINMAPVVGDDTLEGNEDKQKFYSDQIYIDQIRCGVNTGGAMTRKRTLHDLRALARRQQSDWWARLMDQLLFTYLAGARGINDNYVLPAGFTGYAGNPLTAADSYHQIYPNTATAFDNLGTGDIMSLDVIAKAKTRADSQGGGASGVSAMQPCVINGTNAFVCVMHTWQEDDLRKATNTGSWLDLQKAAAASEGANSPIFKGAMGMHRGVVLQSASDVVRFNNAGSGLNLPAARALFMGSQAAAVAFGSPGTNMRFDWHEETEDRGNQIVISTSTIMGVKKVTYATDLGAQDFGLFSIDTYCAPR